MQAGYVIREQARAPNGRISGFDYTVYERPQHTPSAIKPYVEKPDTEKPDMENPDMGKPGMENPTLLSTY